MIGDVNVKLSKSAAERIDALLDTLERINTSIEANTKALESFGLMPPKPLPECCEQCGGGCSREAQR